jgi:hypothetical protein
MIFYPDIGHTMHAQFPVPEWDPVFALTEGREPADPRPVDEAVIYRHFAALHRGFVTYSEGVNDDVNKMLWTQWGWNAATPAQSILEDYARYFLGPRFTQSFAKTVFDLEEDWRGPLRLNAQIEKTLAELQAIEHDPAAPKQNWHLQLALYRAYYDAYLHKRLLVEHAQEAAALDTWRTASTVGAEAAMRQAEAELKVVPDAEAEALRKRVFELAGELYRNVGMQLSVKLYGASNWERGANLDRIDIPLNNRVWYAREFARIRALKDSDAQRAELHAIVNWEKPSFNSLYDDLGNPAREQHLVRGKGFAADPEMYATAIDGVADRTSDDGWRWSELSYAETLYERPIELKYEQLDKQKRYKLRVTYAGEDYAVPIRLLANAPALPAACTEHSPEAAVHCRALACDAGCFELQVPTQRKMNPQTVEYDIPAQATHSGTLDLQWLQRYGQGGSGRGNQVAEVWLIPVE